MFHGMILLVWSSEKAPGCATAIEQEFHCSVRIACNLESACEELKSAVFFAVVIDQHLCDGFPGKAEFLLQHLGEAMPVVVNFAICSTERVVRTLRTSLGQYTRTMQLARQNACATLIAELKDELTALFMACGIALQEPTLSAPVAEQVKRIEAIARQMREKLGHSARLAEAAHA